MANRLMSAYGNLASARTDIGRNLSDIAGIGIEMEYGSEGTIAGKMALSKIANQTAAIGLGLESIQQIAGFGVEYDKETEAAESVGGEEVYKKRIKDESTGEYTTEWGDKGNLFQKLGRFLGFSERQFNVEGQRYTGAQVEAAVPYTKIGKTWAEAAGLTGGGYDFTKMSSSSKYKDPELKSSTTIMGGNKLGAYYEGGVEERDAQGNVITTLKAVSEGDTTTYGQPLDAQPKKVSYGEALQNREMYQSYLSKFHESGLTSEDDWYSLFQ